MCESMARIVKSTPVTGDSWEDCLVETWLDK